MDQAVPTQPTLIRTIVICFMSCRVLDVGLDVSLPMWHLVWPLVIFFCLIVFFCWLQFIFMFIFVTKVVIVFCLIERKFYS